LLTVAFYFFAFLTIFFAINVILAKNPVHSVIFLVLTFFGISANYIFLLNASFLGIVNIIVYAGAIMVLFLFVVMLMNLNTESEQNNPPWLRIAAAIAGGMLLLIIAAVLRESGLQPANVSGSADIGAIKNLGQILYTAYILPFEVASVLFLVAMVGAVVLAKKEAPEIVENKINEG
jgi:NADH-quinone oxidoreductase subunit J